MPKKFAHAQISQQVRRFLAAYGPSPAASICRALSISQPVFSRIVGEIRDDLLVIGKARATRYALRRTVPSVAPTIPIHAINLQGEAYQLGNLHAILPRGFYVESLHANLSSALYDDLPYFLHDARPSGFLGRLAPQLHTDLQVPKDVRLWTGDHCLQYFCRYAWNLVGDLIVGEEAFRRYLQNTMDPPPSIHEASKEQRYPELADDVFSAAPVGSSAAGEQPKFLCNLAPGPRAVLVKFSPPLIDDVAKRWADLLVCEHIAHNVLRAAAHDAPLSDISFVANRMFLEIHRFDRIGEHGRRGLVSLAALDLEFVGQLHRWTDTARVLLEQRLIDPGSFSEIVWRENFGNLIANTDMHLGNLSFFCAGTRLQGLAPIYDMLPMLYAPQSGHIIERTFSPDVPAPEIADVWRSALDVATSFWRAVSTHPMVSAPFKKIAHDNQQTLLSLSEIAHLLPR